MTCQDAIDVMGEALEDRLLPELRPHFDAHLQACRPCAGYFEHLRITREALRALPRERGTAPGRERLLEAFLRRFGPGRG